MTEKNQIVLDRAVHARITSLGLSPSTTTRKRPGALQAYCAQVGTTRRMSCMLCTHNVRSLPWPKSWTNLPRYLRDRRVVSRLTSAPRCRLYSRKRRNSAMIRGKKESLESWLILTLAHFALVDWWRCTQGYIRMK